MSASNKKSVSRVAVFGLLGAFAGYIVHGLTGCKVTMEDERVASRLALSTSETEGGVLAAFSAASNLPQLMSVTSGAVAGSSVLIPPGALAIDVSVTVSQGDSIATTTQAAELGISAALTAAGPSVLFAPSTTTELLVPMQLSIPLTSTATLALMEDETDRYVILYKTFAVKDGETIYYSGLIPRSEFVLSGGFAKFQTSRFGAFQVVETSEKIEEPISKPSTTAPSKPSNYELVGSWSTCRLETSGGGGTVGQGKWSYEAISFTAGGVLGYVRHEVPAAGEAECPAYDESNGDLSVYFAGKYSIGDLTNATLPAGRSGNVRELDFEITGISAIVRDADLVEQLNNDTTNPCGVTWVINTETAISDAACLWQDDSGGGGDGNKSPTVGEKRFGIYNISTVTLDGSEKKTLIIEDDSTDATRPDSFGNQSGPGFIADP